MFDQILTVTVVLLPTIFAIVVELVSEDLKKRKFWRIAVIAFGIVTSLLTYFQIHRADEIAAHDRENAIQRTSEQVSERVSASVSESVSKSVTKSVTEQYIGTIKDLNSQIGNLKAELSAKENRTLQEITGGGQYCYLTSMPAGEGMFQLIVLNSGPLPLDRCFVTVHDNSSIKNTEDVKRNMQPVAMKELGPIGPGQTEGTTTGIVLPAKSYYIQILTRNDRFYEFLTIHGDFPNGKDPLNSMEVRDSKWKLLRTNTPSVMKVTIANNP